MVQMLAAWKTLPKELRYLRMKGTTKCRREVDEAYCEGPKTSERDKKATRRTPLSDTASACGG